MISFQADYGIVHSRFESRGTLGCLVANLVEGIRPAGTLCDADRPGCSVRTHLRRVHVSAVATLRDSPRLRFRFRHTNGFRVLRYGGSPYDVMGEFRFPEGWSIRNGRSSRRVDSVERAEGGYHQWRRPIGPLVGTCVTVHQWISGKRDVDQTYITMSYNQVYLRQEGK